MSHTYTSIFVHYVFSTKNRQKIITPELKERLFPYIGGIAQQNKMEALAIGGTLDHIHILLSLNSSISVANAIQLLKGGSSKWIHDTFPEHRDLSRQEGYGAFSIGVSNLQETINYIKKQEEHHRKKTFKEEYIQFLKKHNINYNERYIWG